MRVRAAQRHVAKKREVKRKKQENAAINIQNRVYRKSKAKEIVLKKKQSKASIKIQNRMRTKKAQTVLKEKQLKKATFFLTLRLQCRVSFCFVF